MKTHGQEMSQFHEKRLAKKVGGLPTPASGAFWSRKGDVRSKDLLIEHKWTGKDRYTIKAETLEKICTEAVLDGRTPVFAMDVGGRSYVLMEEGDWIDLYERSKKLAEILEDPEVQALLP